MKPFERKLVAIVSGGAFPVLMPAVAVGIADNGEVALEQPISLGGEPQLTVPRDQVYNFDEELLLRVNRLTMTANDALDSARHLVAADGEMAFPTLEAIQMRRFQRGIGFSAQH